MVPMRLAVVGSSVTRLCFDHALTILTSSNYEFRFETTSTFDLAGAGLVAFEPESPSEVAAKLLMLLDMEVTNAVADDSGFLRLQFGKNAELAAGPHDEYEAWTMSGPDGERIICKPGGGIATWKLTDS
jgi:Family of unknown function (DUF6188)